MAKIYYPGKRYENAYFITGTRIDSCANIKERLPKHNYKFGSHLRIRYDNQPTQNLQQQHKETQEPEPQENNNISDIEEQLPRSLTYNQQETPLNNIQQDNKSQQMSENEQQTTQTKTRASRGNTHTKYIRNPRNNNRQ